MLKTKAAIFALIISTSVTAHAQLKDTSQCLIIRKIAIATFKAKTDPTIKPDTVEGHGFNDNVKVAAEYFISYAKDRADSVKDIDDLMDRKCFFGVHEANYYDSVGRIYTVERMSNY
ncbi:hypothetical protein ACO0K7_16490 [Undibacterium sp. Ji67W]|uniref:hypothetical protein n=1 Tax=Undibacterium sp. Ji67W TaxID=3413042 RepID=UPI003BF3F6D1